MYSPHMIPVVVKLVKCLTLRASRKQLNWVVCLFLDAASCWWLCLMCSGSLSAFIQLTILITNAKFSYVYLNAQLKDVKWGKCILREDVDMLRKHFTTSNTSNTAWNKFPHLISRSAFSTFHPSCQDILPRNCYAWQLHLILDAL